MLLGVYTISAVREPPSPAPAAAQRAPLAPQPCPRLLRGLWMNETGLQSNGKGFGEGQALATQNAESHLLGETHQLGPQEVIRVMGWVAEAGGIYQGRS